MIVNQSYFNVHDITQSECEAYIVNKSWCIVNLKNEVILWEKNGS